MEESGQFAFVEKASGQIRFMEFDQDGNLFDSGPKETHLTDVTGLSTGFMDGGEEFAILSSTTSNRLAFFSEKAAYPTYFFPEIPGPENAFPFNEAGSSDIPVLIGSTFGNGGDGLQLVDRPRSQPTNLDVIDGFNPLYHAQPLLDPTTGNRRGVAIFDSGGTLDLLELFRDDGKIGIKAKGLKLSPGSQLASEVVGKDGRICTISYVPGQTKTLVFTHSYGGFPESLAPSLELGFGIGSIAPIPYQGIPDAPHGVLITSADGSVAVYATVLPDDEEANEFKFEVLESFEPSDGFSFTGVLPVAGQGIVAFEGEKGGNSSQWRFFGSTGNGWTELSSGQLSPWLSESNSDFATLFWYDSVPLVDPKAKLLQLDIVPDWTLGGGKLPISVERETYLNSSSGLVNPVAYAASGPVGAAYVMTSQVQPNTSVASLADNYTLTIPSLAASPESGVYNTSVVFNLLFDETTVEAYYRRSTDAFWTSYTGPVTIGYPTELMFYAKDLTTGNLGPIGSRSFDFSVDLNGLDSDKDGVPDYVEEYYKLDPFGGADTDLDFQPDLEEILGTEVAEDSFVSSDPNNPLSNIAAEDRNPPFLGEGFFLYAQAFNHTTGFAAPYNDGGSPTTPFANNPPTDADIAQQAEDREDDTQGTNLFAYDMRSTLLSRKEVKAIVSGTLAGAYAARLDVTSNLPDREWLVLSTPTYFGLGTGLPAPRNGREAFRVLQNPAFEAPAILAPPGGSDLMADASAWVDAARTAYAGFDPVTQITRIDPVDTTIAVLAEQVLFEALSTLSTDVRLSLDVPVEVAAWTLFGARDGEASKTSCSQEMIDALLADGFDFEAMLQVIDSQVRASAVLTPLCHDIYARHVAVSDSYPLMALPLDAWRSILRYGNIVDPAPGDPARADPYATISLQDQNDAQTEMLAILASALNIKRPTEQWTLIIEAPTTPGHLYDYRRVSNNHLAWLTDPSGERFIFEQGLGLNPGTSYTITGYTDVDPVAGFDTMEIISIDSIVTPLATDSDSNANLLDDSWEKFFFGELGAVGAFDSHPESGHSYLQYHAAGADPRSGQLSEPVFSMMPIEIGIVWNGGIINAYDIVFSFPDEYVDAFDFGIESSPTLLPGSFIGSAEDSEVTYLGPDRYRLRVKFSESNLQKNFFRITMGLKTD